MTKRSVASMAGTDPASPLLEVLSDYFSPPLARALLTSTLRRAKLDAGPMTASGTKQAVQALELALPLYLGDPGRRAECVARLRARAPEPVPRRDPIMAKAPPTVSRLMAASPPLDASTVIQVTTAEDVANACEVGRDIARRVGFPHLAQTKIATAIAELARNILLYATTGEVHVGAIATPRRGVEVIASDHGPGISDLQRVMSGQYRSRTGMGMGLRGAKKLMDDFDITSSPQGTRVVIRKYVS
jgi:serine/threonine-protein kinase RsbT